MEFGSKSESGAVLKDHIKLMETGKGIMREIEVSGVSQGHQVKIMPGKNLKKVSKTLYLVEDTGVYLEVLTEGITPQVGSEGIYLPLNSKVSYVLLF
jgi:hypothetical protein